MLLLLLCSGCGYRAVGGGGAPSPRLWLEPVDDRGDQPLFGALLTRELIRETADRAGVRDAGAERSGYGVSVRLDSVRETAVAYSTGDITREYLVVAEATATLASAGGDVLWRGTDIRAERSFTAGQSVNETETNKDRALALLAGDLASEILRRVSLRLSRQP